MAERPGEVLTSSSLDDHIYVLYCQSITIHYDRRWCRPAFTAAGGHLAAPITLCFRLSVIGEAEFDIYTAQVIYCCINNSYHAPWWSSTLGGFKVQVKNKYI